MELGNAEERHGGREREEEREVVTKVGRESESQVE